MTGYARCRNPHKCAQHGVMRSDPIGRLGLATFFILPALL